MACAIVTNSLSTEIIVLSWSKLKDHVAAGLVILVTGGVYLATLSPTINSFDSARFITGAVVLGIVHAPGYPLYILLGHLFSKLHLGSIPYNINLLSAVSASLACAVTYYVSRRLSGSLWGSAAASLILGFSRLYWSQATIAEVYALNALLVSLVIAALIAYDENPTSRTLLYLSIAFGVSLTNHLSAVLLGLGIGVLLIRHNSLANTSWKAWFLAISGFCTPLFLYLYLPIRFVNHPPLDYISRYFNVNLASPSGLVWMVSARMFAPEMFGRSLSSGIEQFAILLKQLWLNMFGAGLLLVVIGLLALARRGLMGYILFGVAFTETICLAFYNVVDNDQMMGSVLVLMAPLMAVGFSELWQAIAKKRLLTPTVKHVFGSSGLIAIVVLVVRANWHYADQHLNWQAYDFATHVMAQVKPNALIIAQWTTSTPLEYVQIVENQRPDVQIVDEGMLALGIRDNYYRTGQLGVMSNYGVAVNSALLELVDKALISRPVYVMHNDMVLQTRFCLVPFGDNIYQVLPGPTAQRGC